MSLDTDDPAAGFIADAIASASGPYRQEEKALRGEILDSNVPDAQTFERSR